MAWPVTDFNNVKFNDGSGYAEVVAIHLAIKERAEAIGHSLADGDYATGWTDKVWLADPADASVTDGRMYLRDALQGFYDDIVTLISGENFTPGDGTTKEIRFVQSATTGATEWTEASLVTDIGMGDFADLLTKPANHLPFLWLHEALDRLLYARVARLILECDLTRQGDFAAHIATDCLAPGAPGGNVTYQPAWDESVADTPNSVLDATPILGYRWFETFPARGYFQFCTDCDNVSVQIVDTGITISTIEAMLAITSDNCIETTDVSVNAVIHTVPTGEITGGFGSDGDEVWVADVLANVDGTNTYTADFALTDGVPTVNPFLDPPTAYCPTRGNRIIRPSQARGVYNLTSLLTDQD